MKKKLLFLTLALFVALSGVVYAADKWNGYAAFKVFNGGKEIKSLEPAIVIKNKTFIPSSALKSMGIGVSAGSDRVTLTLPKPIEKPSITLDQVSDIMDSVFEVYGYFPTKTVQGSGFVINNILVTNYHVAGDADKIDIVIKGEKIRKTSADVVFKDEKIDIMGIRLEGQKSLKYNTTPPEIRDTVYTMGFPGGKFRMTQGVVLTVFELNGVNTIVQSALTAPGSSGGLLFNVQGEAVGINSWLSGNMKSGGAVPISYIQNELNKLR